MPIKLLLLLTLALLILTGCLAVATSPPTGLPLTSSATPVLSEFTSTPASTATLPTSTPLTSTPTAVPVTTLLATGDVMLGRSVNSGIKRRADPTWPFHQTRELLSGADITLINLENPFLDPCLRTDSGMVFCAPSSSVAGLSYAGIDVANLANNHILDYGQPGIEQTFTTLKNAGIKASDQDHLVVIEKEGLSFGFLGFNLVRQNPSMTISTQEVILTNIASANTQVDVLVVSFHWGEEYQKTANPHQQQLGHAAIDAGADVIIGTHPHVIQGSEIYQGKPIFYSLGNFVFDQMWSTDTTRGQVVILTFSGTQLINTQILNIQIADFGQPFLLSP